MKFCWEVWWEMTPFWLVWRISSLMASMTTTVFVISFFWYVLFSISDGTDYIQNSKKNLVPKKYHTEYKIPNYIAQTSESTAWLTLPVFQVGQAKAVNVSFLSSGTENSPFLWHSINFFCLMYRKYIFFDRFMKPEVKIKVIFLLKNWN